MKKFLGILVLGLMLYVETANAAGITFFSRDKTYSGEIQWDYKIKIKLPPGEWKLVEKEGWSYNALSAWGVELVQLEGNTIKQAIAFTKLDGGGKWIGYVQSWLYEIAFKNPYDGCYERSEYYKVILKKKGAFFNCLIIDHVDMQKELFHPDDPETRTWSAPWRKYIRENNIKYPPIMLASDHIYFAPSTTYNKMYGIAYAINPELFGASKTKFSTEESSEYHRANIEKYPDAKKFMEEWVKLAVARHREFETQVRAKSKHALDLSEYVAESALKEEISTTSSGLAEELKELYELYKEGILTKEEFEKAKKKILSQ